jgi:hypothetical protein
VWDPWPRDRGQQLDCGVDALIALEVSDVVPMLAGDGFFRAA